MNKETELPLLRGFLLCVLIAPSLVTANSCKTPVESIAPPAAISTSQHFAFGQRELANGNVRAALGVARQMLTNERDPATTPQGRRALALMAAAQAQAGNLILAGTYQAELDKVATQMERDEAAIIRPLLALVELRAGELKRAQSLLISAQEFHGDSAHFESAQLSLTLARAPFDQEVRRKAALQAIQYVNSTPDSYLKVQLVLAALEIRAELAQATDIIDIGRQLDAMDPARLDSEQLMVTQYVRLLLALAGDGIADIEKAGTKFDAALSKFKGVADPRWWWARGRAFLRAGAPSNALLAYQLAVTEANQQRQALDYSLLNAGSSFQQRFGKLFEEYADLLLSSNRGISASDQELLRRAIDVAELSRLADITGLMRDPCLVSDAIRAAKVDDQSTAVLYPFLFEERVELLLLTREGISRSSVPVKKVDLQARVGRWLAQLQQIATRLYLPTARALHGDLVAPVIPELRRLGIKHLVIVPDGLLRTIPFSALHDGKQFLVEEFSLAVVPGLTISGSTPMKRIGIKTLAVGLSEARQGFEALPAVEQELSYVARALQCTPVLNNAFTTRRLRDDLGGSRATIVHVASHAEFSPDPRSTFLLTYDGKLSLEDIRDSLLSSARQRAPLDLLVLSACQTAVGDERAALGLAGMALRTGARSAVASLWQVSDDSTNKLIQRFYGALIGEGRGRSEALRLAQLEVLRSDEFAHPAFWAPFILVGSWM